MICPLADKKCLEEDCLYFRAKGEYTLPECRLVIIDGTPVIRDKDGSVKSFLRRVIK